MKRKDPLDDLELYVDPTPLTKEEAIALSEFIRELKSADKKNYARKSVGRKPIKKLITKTKKLVA